MDDAADDGGPGEVGVVVVTHDGTTLSPMPDGQAVAIARRRSTFEPCRKGSRLVAGARLYAASYGQIKGPISTPTTTASRGRRPSCRERVERGVAAWQGGRMPTAPTLTDGTVTLRHPREDDVRQPGSSARTRSRSSGRRCRSPTRWTTPATSSSGSSRRLGVRHGVGLRGRGRGPLRRPHHAAQRGDRRAELAYGSHPWVRGTGHMERALRVLLDWGFTEKRLAMVIWWANDGNWASRKLAWRLGFTFEGLVRSWLPHRGELRDAWVGTLLPDDPREPQGRWLDLPQLEGEGVQLRAMTPADSARVVEACRDESTRHWLAELPSPYDEKAAAKFIAGRTLPLATGKGLSWAVADPVTDLLLGSVGLFDLTEDLAFGEFGYWTTRRPADAA